MRHLDRIGRWACVALLALLATTACKRDPGGQLPQAGGEKIQAQREAVEGFGLVRAFPDQHDGQLTLALEFSQPLVGTQDFDALLQVDPKPDNGSGWSLSEDGLTLRYPYVEAAKDYQVKVSADLVAADGTRLGQAVDRTVHTGELDPVVGFASQGSVLPARESRGLPVVSVNVEEVDIEFLRVREAELPRFYAAFQRGGRRGGWELDSEYGERTPLRDLAEPAYLNRFVLGGERNERVLNYLPVQDIAELQQPGLYFAVMRRVGRYSDQYDTAFFSVSDIGLHTRAYRQTLYVHAASLHDGSPLKSAELRVLDAKGQVVLKSATDANGNALLDYRLDAGHVLVARRGKDVSLLPFNQPALDLSEFAVGGRAQADFDVFAWSGRDLYRPGETVRISALLRDFDGRALPAPGTGDGKGQPLFLRLKQPDGRVFRETRLEAGVQGHYRFEQEIPADAPTGRWQVEFRTDPGGGDAVQGMTLRIEEFLPERMKLDLSSPEETLAPKQPFKLQADAAYLYGAPADGNRFTARLSVAVAREPLPGQLPGYRFGDATVSLPGDPRDVVDTTFDARGRVSAALPLPEEVGDTTPVLVTVSGSVHESGGRPVSRTLQRVMWPADALVGVRPLFDEADGADANGSARFELVRVDRRGQPAPAKGLQLTLVRELRDYHWRFDDEGGWDYDFTRRFENKQTRTLDAGGSATAFEVPVEWGEYRIDVFDPATGLTLRYPFRAGWSWGDENRGADARPDKVKLALDRTGYQAGDTLKVTVTPPQAGRGVLLVESDKLLYVHDIEVRGTQGKASATFEIPVTEEWERHDVYVTALVFRGGSAASQVTPARAVGVAHVPMSRKDRRVAVGLRVPEQMQPGRDLPVTVSVPQLAGQQAHVTVSAVDVGILNITRFPVPDANAHFFAQRRLATDAYDVYGRVIESFAGGTARLRFGGDMALAALPQARRPTARVQTVDLFSGPVALDARGNARLTLPVPDFNGTLRVSALVYADTRYGNRDAEVLVRAPVVAEAGMPRVLAPGDSATVTLDVQNFSGRAGSFKVRVDGEGPLAIAQGERTLELADGAKSTLNFPLRALEGHSVGKVRVRVDGGGYRVDRRYDLPVRAAWPSILRAQTRVLGADGVLTLDAALAEGLMAESVQARMQVSALPPVPFAAALQGALEYPYGCAEQTTSKGYAGLLLDADTAALFGIGGLDAATRRARLEGAFGRLAAMQSGNGHFSLWGGQGETDPLLTPYIAEFLLDAREAGFAVPEGMLQKALDRLSEDLLSGANQFYGRDRREHLRFANRAYSGYVLARVNRAPLGTLRALYDNEKASSLTGLPLVQLGLALSLQGDAKRAAAAIADGFARDPDQRPYLGDYGSRIRDDALMIALLHERGQGKPEYDARAVALGRAIDARRGNDSGNRLWLSTQEQMALARMGKALGASQGRRIGGQLTLGEVAETIAPARMVSRLFDRQALARGVRFVADGQGPLYASIDVAGIPRQAPAEDMRRIGVVRDWFLPDGKPWRGGTLKEGQTLVVRLTVSADQPIPDALVTDLLPAGLEIENFNLADPAQWEGVDIEGVSIGARAQAADLRHEEFRDDRYVAALRLGAGKSRLFYLVRAVTPGTYNVPPPMAEDMYRPELRGVGAPRPATITVVAP